MPQSSQHSPLSPAPRMLALAAAAVAATVLSGCATLAFDEPPPGTRKQTVFAVTEDHVLLRFNAGSPRQMQQRQALAGMPAGETIVGIDFRVARGVLYGVTSAGRVVTIDTSTAQVRTVGAGPAVALQGNRFGVDFNPVADRIRVVSDTGQNLRLHPDTGALAATDPALIAPAGSSAANVAGAGYTYNKRDDKLTTNFAIDIGRGWLLTQGSVEARDPVVSPNTGRLFDVGALGTGPLEDASFDIADTDNTALAALRKDGRTRLYLVDLAGGKATLLGTVDGGRALRGMAIEP